MRFTGLFERCGFEKNGKLLQVGPIRGDGIARQAVLEPERVAKRVEQPVYGRSSNAGASCISSQRLASRR